MKRLRALLLVLILAVTAIAPANKAVAAEKSKDIVVLYTNDVHCKTGDAESFGYANIAAYKKSLEKTHEYVTLVDDGDHLQGEAIGVLSKGSWLVEIMNSVGYDYAVLGNHEFDYAIPALMEDIKASNCKYLSCNFKKLGKDEPVLDPYAIVTYGDKKVAFIGITTPETFSKSTPEYFKNEKGKYIYTFCEGNNGKDLYDEVQKNIDAVKKLGADYIIAISHLGVDPASEPWTVSKVVANTTGLDVVLDGHSHSVIEMETLKDKGGNEVVVSQTGTKFESFGQLTLSTDGKITTKLIKEDVASEKDADVLKVIEKIGEQYKSALEEKAGSTDFPLYISDPETETRLIRKQETNTGDFVADAYRFVSGADIGVVNGGGIRVNVPAGDITVGTLISLHPFGNELCVKETTGQHIADLLEMSVSKMDENGENENGGFQHVSGLTFVADLSIPTPVVTNDKGEFVKVEGDRRVKNIKVLNSKTGKYEPLVLTKKYTIASHNYMLKSGGDGLTMFLNDKLLQDCVMKDYQVVLTYLQEYCDGKVPAQYKDINGQGRIKLVKAGEVYEEEEEPEEAEEAEETAETEEKTTEQKETEKNAPRKYKVVAGDCLWKIAKKYGTTVDKIAKDNKIKDKNLIFVGQKLVIK
ncbi:MAG: 5'-nucleotidase C-terminal domain-containing protein [Lachnospiraceae bacterium]|nr:5'-nucleotidase C-terminal domain-containing protein [Lachnospiraceae bacterium]